MYWTSNEVSTAPAAAAWREIFPEFRVFTDEDVIPLLPQNFVQIYKLIRLPSAKSDIARLILLREFGGFYLDAHMGPTAPSDLLVTLDKIFEYNVILFGKGWLIQKPTDFDLMNGAIAARKHAPELDPLINRIIDNIEHQWQKEQSTPDYVPYSLFGLTGTYTFLQSFFEETESRPKLKPEFEKTIFLHFMKDNRQSGFEIASHYSYRKPGGHWSERQTHERFFLK